MKRFKLKIHYSYVKQFMIDLDTLKKINEKKN